MNSFLKCSSSCGGEINVCTIPRSLSHIRAVKSHSRKILRRSSWVSVYSSSRFWLSMSPLSLHFRRRNHRSSLCISLPEVHCALKVTESEEKKKHPTAKTKQEFSKLKAPTRSLSLSRGLRHTYPQ